MFSCPLWGCHQPWLPFFCFAAEGLINDALLPDNCSPSLINFVIFGILNFSVITSIKKKSHTLTCGQSAAKKKTFFQLERVKHFSLLWIPNKTFRLLRQAIRQRLQITGLFALVLCFIHLNLSLCSYFGCLIVSSCSILARDMWHENHRFSAHTIAAEKKKWVPERKQAAALPFCYLWIKLESQRE